MQSKYTTEQKKECLNGGYIKKYKDLTKTAKLFLNNRFNDNGEYLEADYNTYYEMKEFIKSTPMLDCAERLQRARHKKTEKVKEKISNIVLSNDAVFITLTFNDETLKNTSEETRRRYVARYLKEQSAVYVANIDFGGLRGREHYHAIVKGRANLKSWKYGQINAKNVRCNTNDVIKISQYITKLTNHAIKSTTCSLSHRLIYSRKVALFFDGKTE